MIFNRGYDIFHSAELLAKLGHKVLVLSAVNKTNVTPSGKPLLWNDKSWKEFGSMSAGTSAAMAARYAGVQRWWAQKVANGAEHGIHILPNAMGCDNNLYAGVVTVKDTYWQEAPDDEKRILEIITVNIARLHYIMVDDGGEFMVAGGVLKFDYVCIPLLGTGFGGVKEGKMHAMMSFLPDNVLVFTL